MTLDWAVVGAVATVIGVAGGLGSLILLILGVRRNARAIEGATVQQLMSFEKDVFAVIAGNAALYLKGGKGLAGLSAIEALAYERIVGMQMSLIYSAYVQYRHGLIDDEIWDAYFDALQRYMRAPGFGECWKIFQNSYPTTFRDMVNAGGRTPAGTE